METIWESLKPVLVQQIINWLTHIGGGALLLWGISEGQIAAIAAAIAAILFGLLNSLLKNKKLAFMHPAEFFQDKKY